MRLKKAAIVAQGVSFTSTSGVIFTSAVTAIELTQGKTAYLDPEDCLRVFQAFGTSWHVSGNGKGDVYAYSWQRDVNDYREHIALHRAVMNARPNQRVKVLNGNPLDCRKANLKIMTKAEQRELICRYAA